ncbi:MAG: permease, partial [Glaciihabitans sp.]|nr:permease [Glaciihabitans sp.]
MTRGGHSHTDPQHREKTPRFTRRRLGWLAFGLIGLVALFALRAVTGQLDDAGLPNHVQDFLTLSISVIIESLPFVVLGVLLSILVQVWIPDHIFIKLMPRNPFARRLVISLLGVLLPVCECGNLPLARGLIVKGLTVSESMTFLLAAPIVNPITIVTTYQAFGFDDGILAARLIGGFVIANLIGWLFSRHPAQMQLLTDRFAAECAMPDPHAHTETRRTKSIDLFVRETSIILPALFLGSVVAGLVQVAVSRQVLVTLGSNPLWSIVAMMVLAFIISICSNVDAFFILNFASTFLPGSIVAFLVFGPMIDIKML